MAPPPVTSAGLEGVEVGESSISDVGGEQGTLLYRGFDVRDLVPGLPYESLVHLLLFGEPPTEDPSAKVATALRAERELPIALVRRADALPLDLAPLDALRALLAILGDAGPPYPPTVDQGLRLIGRLPALFGRHLARRAGQPVVNPPAGLGQVAHFLALQRGGPAPVEQAAALEGYFDLLADHGMNASTFALRIAISTQSDLVSAAIAALSVLRGPLHGGAPSRVIEMLDQIGTPERAGPVLAERLARREPLYGFGHRVYKVEDPRAIVLHRLARSVARPDRLALAESVERSALEALRRAKPGARLFTNVEYYGAVVLEAVGIPPDSMTATFALARTAGWAAHALEQAGANQLIRPDVRYTGPRGPRPWPRPLLRPGAA